MSLDSSVLPNSLHTKAGAVAVIRGAYRSPENSRKNHHWHSPNCLSINHQQIDWCTSYKTHLINNFEANCLSGNSIKGMCLFHLAVKTE